MKVRKSSDFALLIGIDWADKKHDICERITGSSEVTYKVILSTPEAIQEWAMSLKKRFPDQSVAVCCELKKGPLIFALSKYPHIVIFPVNPSTVNQYRKAFASSGAKDDPSDALIQSDLLFLHMDKLRVLEPESPQVRALAHLVEIRRSLVQDRVDLCNRIGAALKNYFPQVLDWFNDKDTLIFCDFLSKWPSLAEVKRARKATLMFFFESHNARYKDVNERRVTEIKKSMALTDDTGVIEPNALLVKVLIGQLRLLIASIDLLDREIKPRYKSMQDYAIFDSFPGAGPKMGPRLLVAFGENRQRYQGSEEIQKYSGVAPVRERSGQKEWVHWRYSCPTFLRQSIIEWAGFSVRFSFWANAYYEQQKEKGKPHQTIIRALAFKWIRIMYRCWKDNTLYDESKYLSVLKKRNAPLLKYAVNS